MLLRIDVLSALIIRILSTLKKKWMLYPTLVQTTCTCSYLVKPAFGPGNSFAPYALDAVRVSGVLQLI